MASHNNSPKNLVESDIFEKNKKKIVSDPKVFDEIITGITFIIAKNPNIFPEISKTGIRIAKTVPGINPPLTIYFKEYEFKIILLDVEITP